MDVHDPARIAAELLVARRSAIAKALGSEIDHCVLFTRLAVDVCRARGIRARALPVSVEITANADSDVMILLGSEGRVPKNAPDDFWDGHLVAVLDGRLLLDLTIDSIAQPEFGIEPEPFVDEVPPEFVTGGQILVGVRGGLARYCAHPERTDYRSVPAWTPGTDDQIARLADALLWPSNRVW